VSAHSLPRRWPLAALSIGVLGATLLAVAPARRETVEPRLLAGLQWRNVGPFRSGRVAAVAGVSGQPGVYYAGFPAGGVWKTTSAGMTWTPIFDDIKSVSSIGAVEVAPSDPNVVYVGTGDMVTGGVINEGDGVYRSADAGKSWQHVGLTATKQIPSMLVDLKNPNVVLVAAQGDIHQQTEERGIYRTEDGGKSWTRVMFVDRETGIQKLARANDVPNTIFATTVRHYNAPTPATQPVAPSGAGAAAPANAGFSGTAIYKSTDGGLTWSESKGSGLPRLAGRTSIAVAMGTNAQRVFLVTNTGLYRSDDGGGSWRQMDAADTRIRNGQGGYNCGVAVDPKNPDIVYVLSTSSYKSTDGGNTFTGFKGAPGGDDPQQIWIDPTDGQRIFLGVDQGATISLDGGKTWSSWYNQSVEQVYHISADNSYPYWIYATQQDAGAIRTRARGNYGAVTMFDWNSVNGWEWGTIIPDPTNPNIVYASGSGIVKISYPSEQWINVSPALDPASRTRSTSSAPITFAPWNSKLLIAAMNVVYTTVDGGQSWKKISGELGIPKGLDSAAAAATTGGRGAIESISASSVGKGTIWVGTNNGLIHVTRDEGKTWTDVSIAGLPNPRRANVSAIEASHVNAGEAYVAVEYQRLGDYAPYLYRTRDFGKSWTKITDGLRDKEVAGSVARVVREDPKKAGLLFAGTETGVYVSFDDGDHWQSLSLNLPNTSYRDITIKGNDLIAGTYGRGIWVLDDISPLRQMSPAIAAAPVHLFAPGDAIRTRRNVNADTPLPPEIPHAKNPPNGAIIYYALASKPSGEITLDVSDSAGHPVRHLSSIAPAAVPEAARPPHPNFWVETPTGIPTDVGLNRTTWDFRHDPPAVNSHSFEIAANPGETPASPEGIFAPPGTYTVTLTVDGKRYAQKVVVRNDPRSPATPSALRAQHALLVGINDGIALTSADVKQITELRGALTKANSANAAPDVKSAITAFSAKLDSVAGGGGGGRGGRGGGAGAAPTFGSINGALGGQLTTQEYADLSPTASALAAFAASCKDLKATHATWTRIVTKDLPALNAVLTKNGGSAITAPSAPAAPKC
jgi:photosystem II stability/assembly factor-like uncharacterized protein